MRKKIPEVRIPVPAVDRLLRLTEAQLKVWLYYKRRYGADGKAWGKANTIGEATNLVKGTVKNARSWLVKHGWLKPNGYSEKGLPMFIPVIGKLPECVISESPQSSENDEGGNSRMTGGVISELSGASFEDDTEVPTQEEATKEEATEEELLASKPASSDSLRSSSSDAAADAAADAETPFDPQTEGEPLESKKENQEQEKEPEEPSREEVLAFHAIAESNVAPMLGVAFGERHAPMLERIARVLVKRKSSPQWLSDMVRWMKQHKFWSKRLYAGDRAVESLAKFLESGECCDQFNSHMAVVQGNTRKHSAPDYAADLAARSRREAAAIPVGDAGVWGHESPEYRTVGKGFNVPDPLEAVGKGFDPEEA